MYNNTHCALGEGYQTVALKLYTITRHAMFQMVNYHRNGSSTRAIALNSQKLREHIDHIKNTRQRRVAPAVTEGVLVAFQTTIAVRSVKKNGKRAGDG